MGSRQSVLKAHGYELVSEREKMMLVKNKGGDQFVLKKLNATQVAVSNFLQQINHPHILHHKELIRDGDCLYLVLEHCKAGDLAEKTKLNSEGKDTFSELQILDWTVKICMALKHLHDQHILHKNLQTKSIFFTECETIRLGEFGVIHEWSIVAQPAETKDLSSVAPENLNGIPYDEKSEMWSLGCVVYEMCTQKCAFTGRSTIEITAKILNSSYEALPETFSEDLRQLVKDMLQIDPEKRPSVSQILMRPFIINHLHEKSTQTIKDIHERLNALEELAAGLEKIHFHTTVSSLTGRVVGLAGGITSLVGLILSPFTLGASLIVTGVGIGVAVAGGVTSGASNITKMVNQGSNRQKIKMIITEIQEKITSTSCCIQNIQIAVETKKGLSQSNESWSDVKSGADWANIGARLGRGLGEIASAGKVQTARTIHVAEAATDVLSALCVAVDVVFIAIDSKDILKLHRDSASTATQPESETAAVSTETQSKQTAFSADDKSEHSDAGNHPEQELQSEIMKFVKKIRETKKELTKILNELNVELQKLKLEIQTDN